MLGYMKAINYYVVIEKIKEAPKKVGGLELTEDQNKDVIFLTDIKNMAKDQLIDITIFLPVNTILYLDGSTRTFLDDVDNIQNIHDRDMPKHYYKMTENGLECLDCDPTIFGERYKKENGHGVCQTKTFNGVQSAETKESSWGLFILALISGFAALLTPCVFPMIPMTVSFFIKNKNRKIFFIDR